jgi:hypothetical protein
MRTNVRIVASVGQIGVRAGKHQRKLRKEIHQVFGRHTACRLANRSRIQLEALWY